MKNHLLLKTFQPYFYPPPPPSRCYQWNFTWFQLLFIFLIWIFSIFSSLYSSYSSIKWLYAYCYVFFANSYFYLVYWTSFTLTSASTFSMGYSFDAKSSSDFSFSFNLANDFYFYLPFSLISYLYTESGYLSVSDFYFPF